MIYPIDFDSRKFSFGISQAKSKLVYTSFVKNNFNTIYTPHIQPKHYKIFDNIDQLVSLKIKRPESIIDIINAIKPLIFELFDLEIELHLAYKIKNSFLRKKSPNLYNEKKLIEEIKKFQNYIPREMLIKISTFYIFDTLDIKPPISNQELDGLITYCNEKIKAQEKLKIKPVFSNSSATPKNILKKSFSLNKTKTELRIIYFELIKANILDEQTNVDNFILTFTNVEISTDFEKITWKNKSILSVLISEYIDSRNKWETSKLLFNDSRNLKIIFQNYRVSKKFNETLEYLKKILTY